MRTCGARVWFQNHYGWIGTIMGITGKGEEQKFQNHYGWIGTGRSNAGHNNAGKFQNHYGWIGTMLTSNVVADNFGFKTTTVGLGRSPRTETDCRKLVSKPLRLDWDMTTTTFGDIIDEFQNHYGWIGTSTTALPRICTVRFKTTTVGLGHVELVSHHGDAL